jgi:hypothetical protein
MATWPELDADRALREATVRLVAPGGGLAGTAFLVGGEGLALTCHHVVAGHDSLRAIDSAGRAWTATPTSLDDAELSQSDMALVRLTGGEGALPPPLPLVAREPGTSFASRVQQKDGEAYRDAAPLAGVLRGPTRIAYGAYRVEGRAVAEAQVQPGMSGSVVWDRDAAAAIGLLAVSAGLDPNLGGFAIPFAHAGRSERLREVIAQNEAAVPRYGDRPNSLGLIALLGAGSAHARARLLARGILQPDRYVPREGFPEALDTFLASDRTALAIVSAAGQGKTNLLAQVGELRPDRPSWLARAADLAEGDPPARGLNRLLQNAGAPPGLVWPKMAEACGLAPILLLDGLNEAPIPEHRIASDWLPDLIAEAADAGWRVIYTTRRELYAALPDATKQAQGAFTLGRFNSREAAAAAAAYGAGRRRGGGVEREPLLLRIRAEVGGDAPRSEVLNRFVRRLVDEALARARGAHPAALLQRLAELAERAARDETGVAPYDDPFFADAVLTEALCDANLLEEVPAGYRFVFDEVADFLHAQRAAAAIAAGAAVPSAAPNVLGLALELLDDGKAERAEATATALANRVAEGGRAGVSAFATISAIPDAPGLIRAKALAVEAAANDDDLVQALIRQPDLLAGFRVRTLAPLVRAAILLQHGYGWREKDIYSDAHRGGTVMSARMSYGVLRVIHDLIDDPGDGVALLIDWLDDTTALSNDGEKFKNREASVGSFALCMLFAHRERIGLPRLFEDVLFAERRGWDSMMEALAAEETDAFAAWLEGLDPALLATRLSWTIRAWRYLMARLDARGRNEGQERAARAFATLVPHLDAAGLGELLSTVIGAGVPFAGLAALARRTGEAGALSPFTLGQAFKNGVFDFDETLELAGDVHRDAVVLFLIGAWDPDRDRPPLARLVDLLRRTPAWRQGLWDGRYDFETLLNNVPMGAARASGLCAMIEAQVAEGPHPFTHNVHAVFSGSAKTPEQAAFQAWLAELVAPALSSQDRRHAIELMLTFEDEAFAPYRRLFLGMIEALDADDLVAICMTQSNAHHPILREALAAFLARHGVEGRDELFLLRLLSRLEGPDPPDGHAIHNQAYAHIMEGRED